MALGDPFSTTYEGARQGIGSIGEGILQAAGLYAQRKQQERELTLRKQERHQQIMGSLFGEFVKQGYIKPNKEMMDSIVKEFGVKGFDLSKPQNITDIANSLGAGFAIKDIRTDPMTGNVIDVTWKSPDEVKKEQAELQIKKEETQSKIKEREIKERETKSAEVKQAWQGLPFFGLLPSKEKTEAVKIQSQFRKQLLGKGQERIRVRRKSDKKSGTILESDFDSNKYERL